MASDPSRELSNDHNRLLQESRPSSASRIAHSCDRLFRMFDQNNDGEVTLDEMDCLVRKLGIEVSQNCLMSLIESVDHSEHTALNFSQFTALYQSIHSSNELDQNAQEKEVQPADEELDSEDFQDAFNVYDKNKDGYICAAELAEVLRDLGFSEGTDLQECQKMIDNVDADGNGLVDLQEFKAMLSRGI